MFRELREKRAKLIADAREAVRPFAEAGNALSAEAKERVDKLRAEAQAIADTLKVADEIDTEDRAIVPESQRVESREQTDERVVTRDQRDAAVSAFLRGRTTDEQRVILARMDNPEFRDQSTSGTAGGYTIATDTRFYGQIVDALKAFGGMLAAPLTVLETDNGADLPFPTVNDTSNVGAIVAEAGSHASGTDLTFGQLTLKAYVISSKIVKVSQQLMQDSSAAFETYLARKLGERVARKLNALLSTGTGSSQPQGIAYPSASIGRTCATGYSTTCTADDLLRLLHSVDPAYRDLPACRWMMNDTSALNIALLKDGNSQYIWRPGMSEGSPDVLFGKRVIINQDMPDMASSTKAVAFGDFSSYYYRVVRGIQIVRLNELYAETLQTGFMAYMRADGGLIDAGMHPVRVLAMAA